MSLRARVAGAFLVQAAVCVLQARADPTLPDYIPKDPSAAASGSDAVRTYQGRVELSREDEPGAPAAAPAPPSQAVAVRRASASKSIGPAKPILAAPAVSEAPAGRAVSRSLQRKLRNEEERERVRENLRQQRERRPVTRNQTALQIEENRKDLELRRLTEQQRRLAAESRKDYLQNLPDRSGLWRERNQEVRRLNRDIDVQNRRVANELDRTAERMEQNRLRDERRRELVRDQWRSANDRLSDNPAEFPWSRQPPK